jgi:acyl carrier protein
MSVRLRLRQIVLGVLDEPDIEYNDELSPANCAAWDSVAMVQIVLAVEEAFEVRFATKEIADLRSVGDLVKLLESHGHRDES